MQLPLDGIKVIELAQHLAGPGTGMYLADQGAEVIKIEPVAGTSRQAGSASRTPSQLVLNRNKRGMTLDFRRPEGREVLLRLVETADVLIHNFRVGVAERRGIGYDDLSKINPRLIYASITAFGSRGPWATKGGYDRLTQGLSGAMYRRDKDGIPLATGIWVSDCSVPMLMSYGIMLALWVREKTGRGQKVETSLLQAALAMQTTNMVRVGDKVAEPVDAGDAYGIFRCLNDDYLNVCALQPDQFRRFCDALGVPELAADGRFFDPRHRAAFRIEAYPIIDGVMSTKAIDEWVQILDAVDVPCAPILARPRVFDEAQMVDNGMIVTQEHPSFGRVTMVNVPVQLSETPGGVRGTAPAVGEHTDQILQNLGYSPDAIAGLREAAVV